MDINGDSTCIIKSLKDLNKFMLQGNKSNYSARESNLSFLSPASTNVSPKLKLSFTDSVNNDSFSESLNGSNESFLQRHHQSTTGFDVVKKIRDKDCEIVENKATISILESRLETLQSTNKKRKLDYESYADSYKQKLLQNDEVINGLQHKIKLLESSELEMKDELLKVQKIYTNKCNQMEHKILQQRSEHLERSNQYHKELSGLRENLVRLEKDIKEKSSSLFLMETANNELDERCKLQHNKIVNYEKNMLELDYLKTKYSQSQMKITELEIHLNELRAIEANCELFDKSVKRLSVLEKEVAKLREENNMHKIIGLNVGLLEEQLKAAESDIKRLETRNSELIAENATLVTLHELSEKAEAAIMNELELEYMPPAFELVERLQSLKKRDVESLNTLTELKASLKSHDETRINNNELVKTLQKELDENRGEVEKRDQIIRRLQRKIVLVSKERDTLKGIMSSYEAESTINPSMIELEKINSLEAILKDYKNEISKLEDDILALHMEGKTVSIIKPSHQTTLVSSKNEDELIELKKLVEALIEEKDNLELKLDQHILKGSYDPSKTKVLHFQDNPLEKANRESKAEYDCLLQENSSLKLRVKLLEDGDNLDLTQKVGTKVNTDDISSKKLKDLEDELKTLETRNQRIVDAFKQKSQEMREVVYRLTGYRVDLRGDNIYKLINMYAESADDYLLFEETNDGVMNLLETEFSATLHSLIEAYLHHDNGYPAFLSAVTLDLYNKQTMVHSPHSSNDEDEYEGGEGDYEGGEGEDYEGEEEAEEYEGEDEEYDEEDDEMDEEDGQAGFATQDKEEDNDDDLICID